MKGRWFFLSLLMASLAIAEAPQAIRAFDFKKYLLAGELKECSEPPTLKIDYADLTGDGIEEAIVQGSSCLTGTAGPDIHEIYALVSKTQVRQLELPEIDKKHFSVLFGNPNFELVAKNGKLVAFWNDTSGRDRPLTIHYEWSGERFTVGRVETSPVQETSYDCSRAKEEHELAICYVPALAELDRKLGEVYRKALDRRSAASRKWLVAKEKKWVASRNEACPIYKWWVECLTEQYKKRIAELSVK